MVSIIVHEKNTFAATVFARHLLYISNAVANIMYISWSHVYFTAQFIGISTPPTVTLAVLNSRCSSATAKEPYISIHDFMCLAVEVAGYPQGLIRVRHHHPAALTAVVTSR